MGMCFLLGNESFLEQRIQDYLDEQEQQACGSMATLKSCERRVENLVCIKNAV